MQVKTISEQNLLLLYSRIEELKQKGWKINSVIFPQKKWSYFEGQYVRIIENNYPSACMIME